MRSLFCYMRFIHTVCCLLVLSSSLAQQRMTKSFQAKATDIEIKVEGLDFLILETAPSQQVVLHIEDRDGLGVQNSFECNAYVCAIGIKSELRVAHPLTNKINQFTQKPPSNVSARIQIPAGKNVAIFGTIVDISSNNYQGNLGVIIEQGKLQLNRLMGKARIAVSTGSVYAKITDNSLDIRTGKGRLVLDEKPIEQGVLNRQKNPEKLLTIRTQNANIILSTQTQ